MNAKIYNGNVQPNPKEFKIWINDEGLIKTWNGTEWIEATTSSGGSGSGEASTIEYFDMSDENIASDFKNVVLAMSNNVKVDNINSNPRVYIAPYSYLNQFQAYIPENIVNMAIACEFDFSKIMSMTNEGTFTIEDWIKFYNLQEKFDSIPRITKEEFYAV